MPRVPIVIFLFAIILSQVLGLAIIYSTVEAHRKGEYLHLENEVLEVNFPLNWFIFFWEEKNETTSGKTFRMVMFGSNVFSVIAIQILDEKATRQFIIENNLSDISLASSLEAQRFYQMIRKENENASITSEENGTLNVGVSKDPASYTNILIENGYKIGGSFLNVSYTVISYVKGDNLVEIIFWGKKEDCEKTSKIFEEILSTAVVKSYGSE